MALNPRFFICLKKQIFPPCFKIPARYPELMREKSKKEKDKEIREAINFAAERLAHILWEHWLWLKKKEKDNLKKDNS